VTGSTPRLAFRIDEAAASLGVDIAEFMRTVLPELRLVQVGGLELVPVSEIERVLAAADGERHVEPVALTCEEAARCCSVSRDFFDKHIRPELKLIRRGRLVLVRPEELRAWAERSSSLTLSKGRHR
jgi:hypothetical protein